MRTTFLALACSTACFFAGCAARGPAIAQGERSITTSTADTIPRELVGEWRNSNDGDRYAAIYLFPDGRGGLLASEKGTVIGSKNAAVYDSETFVLTLSTLRTSQEGDRMSLLFDYDPSSKTILSRRGGAPFTRRSAKIPRHIKEEFD